MTSSTRCTSTRRSSPAGPRADPVYVPTQIDPPSFVTVRGLIIEVPDDQVEDARNAAGSCPARAIILLERRITLHLPQDWPWEHDWLQLFDLATADPPQRHAA